MNQRIENAAGVLFDLDDTLFDCTGSLTGPARIRAAKVLAEATGASLDGYVVRQSELSETLGSRGAISRLAAVLGLPREVGEAALAAYDRDTVEPIVPFPGTIESLDALDRAGLRSACVTTGTPVRQRAKIRQLGLDDRFTEADGTLVLHDPEASGVDKQPFLERAARGLGLPLPRSVVVGDKLDSEIAAGNRLGSITVHLRHGRHANRVPASRDERPGFAIDRISDLLGLLGLRP